MAIETFTSGPYAATYNAVSTGITKSGYEITYDHKSEEIAESDLYGMAMLDTINRGANVSCDFTCLAYTKGTAVLNPFTSTLFQLWTAAGPIGRLGSDAALALVLTATANTPAATNGPVTLTASKSIIAPNFSTKFLMDSQLRTLPLKLQFLPYTSSSTLIFCATT